MMNVPETQHQSEATVEFRSPLLQRFFKVFKAFLVFVLVGLFLAATIWGALLPNLFRHQPPLWAHLAGAGILLLFAAIIFWTCDRLDPTRLVLNEDGLWVGGRIFGRSLLYNDLRLIKQEKPEKTVGQARQLIVEKALAKPLAIWLSPKDAEECFDALRALCEHAPAIGLASEIYEPADSTFADRARFALVRDFRRKARRGLAGAIGAAVLTIAAVLSLTLGGKPSRTGTRNWVSVIVLPLAAIGSMASYLENRRRIRELEAQDNSEDEDEDGDDENEDDGEE